MSAGYMSSSVDGHLISVEEFDQKFDDCEDISEYLDWSTIKWPNLDRMTGPELMKEASDPTASPAVREAALERAAKWFAKTEALQAA